MLRIHLTAADVTRLSFAAVPHLELFASVQTLLRPNRRPGPDRWRRRALPRLPAAARPLLDLVAETDSVPMVLVSGCGVECNGGPAALVAACRAYEDACLVPVRESLRSSVDAELVRVGQSLLSSGAGAELDGLGAGVGFDGRTLTVAGDYGGDVDVELAGRGLRLIPTYFWRRPAYTDEGVDTPVLVYPIARPRPHEWAAAEAVALEKLLGRNRARVLRAAVSGGGTGELARALGISAASASEHLAVLRDAGFVVSRREGKSVRHQLTALGAAALRVD